MQQVQVGLFDLEASVPAAYLQEKRNELPDCRDLQLIGKGPRNGKTQAR
jgi:hypothetical protein